MTFEWEVVAEGLQFPEGPVPLADGTVLVSEMAAGRVTRVHPDGRLEEVARTGGGPNGLAVLPDGGLAVCQGGGSGWAVRPWPHPGPGSVDLFLPSGPPAAPLTPQIQTVSASGDVVTLHTADETGEPLKRPSDIAVDGHGGIYVTDFGGLQGRTRALAGVLYAAPGGALREVVFPVELANGVALAPDGGALYVTETRTRRVWRFELVEPGVVGAWHSLATVPAGGPMGFGGADGCCVDAEGTIVVATIGLGGVTMLSPDGEILAAAPLDDPMPTNVAFGGPDGTTLFVTCGSSGRLLAMHGWHTPGAVGPPSFATSTR